MWKPISVQIEKEKTTTKNTHVNAVDAEVAYCRCKDGAKDIDAFFSANTRRNREVSKDAKGRIGELTVTAFERNLTADEKAEGAKLQASLKKLIEKRKEIRDNYPALQISRGYLNKKANSQHALFRQIAEELGYDLSPAEAPFKELDLQLKKK